MDNSDNTSRDNWMPIFEDYREVRDLLSVTDPDPAKIQLVMKRTTFATRLLCWPYIIRTTDTRTGNPVPKLISPVTGLMVEAGRAMTLGWNAICGEISLDFQNRYSGSKEGNETK